MYIYIYILIYIYKLTFQLLIVSTTVFLKDQYFPYFLLYILYSITNYHENLRNFYLQLIRRQLRT